MPKPLKFPQVVELQVGKTLLIPLVDAGRENSFRVLMHSVSKRYGIKLSVHFNKKTGYAEVSRVENVEPENYGQDNYQVVDTPQRGYSTHRDIHDRITVLLAERRAVRDSE